MSMAKKAFVIPNIFGLVTLAGLAACGDESVEPILMTARTPDEIAHAFEVDRWDVESMIVSRAAQGRFFVAWEKYAGPGDRVCEIMELGEKDASGVVEPEARFLNYFYSQTAKGVAIGYLGFLADPDFALPASCSERDDLSVDRLYLVDSHVLVYAPEALSHDDPASKYFGGLPPDAGFHVARLDKVRGFLEPRIVDWNTTFRLKRLDDETFQRAELY
jgi:hypothetical protein